jgi:glycosyltransferase involved in cell wall biosynthesis
MKPISIPSYISHYLQADSNIPAVLESVKKAYQQNLVNGEPEISIVMPAYNEAKNIVPTLMSLCNNIIDRSVEIIVVDNNSTDNTGSLIKACGVNCLLENIQGITYARNAGLAHAKGKYVLNADADTIYPKNWIDEMTKPLINNNNIAITYGLFSFIPIGNTGRVTYYFYELLSDITRFYNKYRKTEAVNVYGFNSGFRREQGMQVDGFNHPPGTNEDGFLALKLFKRGFGDIFRVKDPKAIVWTTDRRIQIDGGLWQAIFKRLNRVLNIR